MDKTDLARAYASNLWESQGGDTFEMFITHFNQVVDAAIEMERERCAKIVDERPSITDEAESFAMGKHLAQIRGVK